MSTSFIRGWQGKNKLRSKTGKKKNKGGGGKDHTQQVARIIFVENMNLLIEALKGDYLLSLTSDSFVILRLYD